MSTMQIVDEQLGRIASGNRFYNYNRNNWRFLLTSYLGGEDYKRGQYLTRYQLETDSEYAQRLETTPLENHCRAVINVYNSFLFREQPERDLGSMTDLQAAEDFLRDADLEGRSLDAFMRDVSTWASVFGHCWVMMAKPNVGAVTRADEQIIGVRPYVSLLTPLVVVDWHWERLPTGYYDLKRFKYVEEINGSVQTVRQWTPDTITTWHIDFDTRTVLREESEPNGLGFIPVTCVYSQRSMVRGIGVSDIQDIAGMQKFIYNQLSEVEQTVRMDGHPSLVKTNETQASAGAGSIVAMPENLDPGLKPYLLEYNGASITSIYQAIAQAVDSIDKMANTGSVRATAAKLLSGVAMQTEFQLLNAKLSEKANNLELAEEQMWKIFALYSGTEWDGEIHYQDSYSIQDEEQEYTKLQVAKSAATSPEALGLIDQKLIELINDSLSIEESGPSILTSEDQPQGPQTEPSAAGAVTVTSTGAVRPVQAQQPRVTRRRVLEISNTTQ
ncbi:Portal protein [uncultured Caudovirales phage]|uniref:Portal protein n=1 Tax=uncultured Caudovirales phage TaxID=2100421 RepID=A0A6J5L456_9CAUD|nr:Portal protein [uncultured Caudovirales phage]CAB5219115.1 Portal protein [uncultured Caudovirales phage]